MKKESQKTEVLLGFFVLVGVVVMALLIYRFGKLEGKFQNHYQLFIQVSDATGIRKGVPVRLGGVNIGYVSGKPRLNDDFTGMSLPLNILEEYKIPKDSKVTIGSAGLMGDSYVKIALPTRLSGEVIEPGSSLKVGVGGGIQSLQADAETILTNVNDSVLELNDALNRLDQIFGRVELLLNDENTGKLNTAIGDLGESASKMREASQKLDPLFASAEEAMDSMKKTAETVTEASEKLDPLLVSANDAVTEVKTAATAASRMIDSAEKTLETGSAAIDDLAGAAKRAEPTLEEVEAFLADFRKTLTYVDSIASTAVESDGFLKALLEDPHLKDEMISLIQKLETHGVIFYPREKKNNRSTSLFTTKGRSQR